MYDVLIIGAGIVGLTIARRLARYQLKIAIVEKEPDVAMGATKANSAIVHGGFAESHTKKKGQLCYQGRIQFSRLNSELNFGFRETGSLVITANPDDLPALEALLANGRRNGLDDLEILGREQILAREPTLNPDVRYALLCRGAGICSPYGMAIAMAENAVANGADLYLDEAVMAIERLTGTAPDATADLVFQVRTSHRVVRTRYLINCAGVDSESVACLAGPATFSIHPRSGEYLLFERDTGSLVNSVVFQMPTRMGKGILVTPTIYGNLLLGPDAIDEESGRDRSTHVARLAAIYRQGLLTAPGIDITRFLRSFTGVRAVASTDDFIIEMSPVHGFVNVAGIQSPGVTTAPAIADQVALLLEDAGLILTPDPAYQAYRPPLAVDQDKPRVTMAEAARLAQLPGGPDRLICRCEQVAERAIFACLQRGIPVTTIDGIKRRTRASMGFCQGQFCRPRLLTLLKERGYRLKDSLTDAERDGSVRVTKKELLAYLKETS